MEQDSGGVWGVTGRWSPVEMEESTVCDWRITGLALDSSTGSNCSSSISSPDSLSISFNHGGNHVVKCKSFTHNCYFQTPILAGHGGTHL